MAASATTGVAVPATSILGANPQANDGGWGSWCLAAIQNLLQLPMQFGTADSAFYGYRAKGMQVQAPLPGDMAFFGPSSGNGGAGHVGIVNGDGTYTSVLNDGKFHVLPLAVTSLGANLLGFVSSAKAGAVNPFASLGKLKDKIGGVTTDGGATSPATVQTGTNYGGGTGDLLNPLPAPSLGDPMNPPRPAGTYINTGKCPPTPPGNKVYNDTIDLPAGQKMTVPGLQAVQQIGDYFGYLASYFGCIAGSIINFITTPGYWWRAVFVLAGLGLVVIGGKTYFEGDIPQALQSVGK